MKEEKFGAIFWLHLLPMMLITTALEGLGLAHWGKWQPAYKTIKHYSIHGTLVYEAGQFVLNLGMILVCARLVQVLGRTFHGRITYTYPRSLAVVVYGLSPMFLLRLLDPFAGMNPYVTWGLGILLSIWVLYDGLPRLLMPDPTHVRIVFVVRLCVVAGHGLGAIGDRDVFAGQRGLCQFGHGTRSAAIDGAVRGQKHLPQHRE